jgi:hypothetical protein
LAKILGMNGGKVLKQLLVRVIIVVIAGPERSRMASMLRLLAAFMTSKIKTYITALAVIVTPRSLLVPNCHVAHDFVSAWISCTL